MGKNGSRSKVIVHKTNIRRVRKWKKRRNWAPYIFFVAILIFGLIMTFLVYSAR